MCGPVPKYTKLFSPFHPAHSVPLFAGLYWRRAKRQGAFAAMALGLATSLFFGGLSYFKINLIPMPVHFSFYAFIIFIVAMIAISLETPPHSETLLDETMTGWYIRE
jgi:Na+/proline symporter